MIQEDLKEEINLRNDLKRREVGSGVRQEQYLNSNSGVLYPDPDKYFPKL